MAFAAASSNAGTHRPVNEDACCIEAAQTDMGEVLMAIVCDGVGGLSRGNVASSTVVDRFARWFEGELPLLMEGMAESGRFDFGMVQAVWGALLQNLNDLIRDYGVKAGGKLGTTFTGIMACGGHYLVGHVGDCRAYQMSARSFAQITQDQTLVAKRLAAGEITEEEARRSPKNVILQAVGTQRVLNPVFSEGSYTADDLFVICCDGAYHRAENEGIRKIFQGLDYRNGQALQAACDTLLQVDMDYGEKDNLTVACFSGALAAPGETVLMEAAQAAAHAPRHSAPAPEVEDGLPTMVDGMDEDDLPTAVEPDGSDEDDLPTMVDASDDTGDEDDLPTMVDTPDDEDDAPTMVDFDEDEDDLPTMVDANDAAGDEDDLPTMVDASDDPVDEDDLPTMVDAGEPSDLTDEDDLPTMVEGGDA